MQKSVELLYTVELGIDGMMDGPRFPGSLCTAERLDALLQRRARWRGLAWEGTIPFPVPYSYQVWQTAGGIFASIPIQCPDRIGLKVLPSLARPVSSNIAWITAGVPIINFAIDPSQDLAALVQIFDDGT